FLIGPVTRFLGAISNLLGATEGLEPDQGGPEGRGLDRARPEGILLLNLPDPNEPEAPPVGGPTSQENPENDPDLGTQAILNGALLFLGEKAPLLALVSSPRETGQSVGPRSETSPNLSAPARPEQSSSEGRDDFDTAGEPCGAMPGPIECLPTE